jgi:hypothetical protein
MGCSLMVKQSIEDAPMPFRHLTPVNIDRDKTPNRQKDIANSGKAIQKYACQPWRQGSR